MAAKGSGRNTTSDYRALDIRELRRAGMLRMDGPKIWSWYRGERVTASMVIEARGSFILLGYRIREEERAHPVQLSWSNCHYGGTRPWFLCPDCGRRVAILYGGPRFLCRHCRRLAYDVQRESENDRVIRRADAIRERLGWHPGILQPNGFKPSRMHWQTYWRLCNEYHRLAGIGLEGISRELGIVSKQMDCAGARIRALRSRP
jgi:hypothetical protein